MKLVKLAQRVQESTNGVLIARAALEQAEEVRREDLLGFHAELMLYFSAPESIHVATETISGTRAIEEIANLLIKTSKGEDGEGDH